MQHLKCTKHVKVVKNILRKKPGKAILPQMQSKWLIGLSGTNGAGKDAVGLLLAQKHHFLFISVTELLRKEAERRGLPVERQFLRKISAEWRREFGYAVLVDRAVKQYEPVKEQYAGLVLASLRNPVEADRVHELGGTMLWIDGDPQIRYQRIRNNAAARNRGGEDDVTFEQFQIQEAAEMHARGDDAALLDMAEVKTRCELELINNSDDLDDLDRRVVTILNL